MTGFGAPVDPAYSRFLAGLQEFASDPGQKKSNRWRASDEKWLIYDPSVWGMDDLGLSDTSPESAVQDSTSAWPRIVWKVQELFVPDLFARVRKAGQLYKARHPSADLIWSPLGGGDWRAAFKRAVGSPAPSDPDETDLPPECVRRIEQVRGFERRGFITHDQAQRMINAIVEECT